MPTVQPHEPTLATGMFRMVLGQGAALGVPRAELLATAGLDEADLIDPDARLPLHCQLAVGRALAHAFPRQNVGLRALRFTTPASLGTLGFALRHCTTLGDALHTFARFQGLVTDAAAWTVDGPRVRVAAHPDLAALVHPIDNMVGLWVHLGRMLTGVRWVPTAVYLPHPPLGDPREHHAHFGMLPTFDAPETGFDLSAPTLALPVQGARLPVLSGLLHHLEAQVEDTTGGSTRDRVMGELRQQVARGGGRKQAIAKALGMSPRTLSRKLGAEGASFQALLDEARAELAKHCLRDPSLAIYEVALLLGYSEPAPFHRAFRRWTGTSPSRWRASALPASGKPSSATA